MCFTYDYMNFHSTNNNSRIIISLYHRILVESGIVSETKTGEHTKPAYQPARDINILTIKYIINALEQRGTDKIPVAQTKELKTLSEALQTFDDTIEKSPVNSLLKDI